MSSLLRKFVSLLLDPPSIFAVFALLAFLVLEATMHSGGLAGIFLLLPLAAVALSMLALSIYGAYRLATHKPDGRQYFIAFGVFALMALELTVFGGGLGKALNAAATSNPKVKAIDTSRPRSPLQATTAGPALFEGKLTPEGLFQGSFGEFFPEEVANLPAAQRGSVIARFNADSTLRIRVPDMRKRGTHCVNKDTNRCMWSYNVRIETQSGTSWSVAEFSSLLASGQSPR